jgi:hypothetical protein
MGWMEMGEAVQDGYKHRPGAFDNTADGAQWEEENRLRESTLTRGEDSRVPSHGCDEDAW